MPSRTEYAFTIFSILLFATILYLYFFERSILYDQILDRIFEPSAKREEEYGGWVKAVALFSFMYLVFNPICKWHIEQISKAYYRGFAEKRLYDLGHAWIPQTTLSRPITEILITVIFVSVAYLYFFSQRHSITTLTNLLYLMAIMIFLRCIFFSVTLLPKTNEKCQKSLLFQACNDLIFSGHVSKTLILLLVMNHDGVFSPFFQKIYLVLFLAMLYFIISARNHYTIDILVALLLTYLIYHAYYTIGF